MFATGQQPVLIRLAKRHERVFIVAYADNIFLVGDVESCFQLTTELIPAMSEDLDLDIQLNSSWVHVPAWAHMTSTPDIYDDILAKFPSLRGLPVQLNGAKVLGCPLGSPAYTRAETDKLASNIISLYDKIRDVPDGRIHFQLVKFCIHTKFQYILRCLPPAATMEAATRLDAAACGAVMTYGGCLLQTTPT